MKLQLRPVIWQVWLAGALICFCQVSLVRAADGSSDESAKRLFHRFLDRLKDDAPVVGEFEIRRSAVKGLGRGVPQQKRLLRCRWAWEQNREMLEGLPESTEFEHFLSTRAALLQAMGPLNYNISVPKAAAPTPLRPSSFYFLLGAVPWFDKADAEVKLVANDINTPPETRVVRVQLDIGYVNLFIRESDGRHLGHDSFLEGELFHRLRITKLMTFTDGRAFPLSARLESFLGTKRQELIFADELRTIHVRFPRGTAQIEPAFATEVPAASIIHDLEHNTHVTLSSATSALHLIEEKVRKDRAVIAH